MAKISKGYRGEVWRSELWRFGTSCRQFSPENATEETCTVERSNSKAVWRWRCHFVMTGKYQYPGTPYDESRSYLAAPPVHILQTTYIYASYPVRPCSCHHASQRQDEGNSTLQFISEIRHGRTKYLPVSLETRIERRGGNQLGPIIPGECSQMQNWHKSAAFSPCFAPSKSSLKRTNHSGFVAATWQAKHRKVSNVAGVN